MMHNHALLTSIFALLSCGAAALRPPVAAGSRHTTAVDSGSRRAIMQSTVAALAAPAAPSASWAAILGFEAPPDNAGAKLGASGLSYDIGLGSANKNANTAGAGSKSAYAQSGGEDSAARLALVRSKLSDQLNELTALVPLIENAKWAELGREMTSPAMQEFNLVLSRLALDSPELQSKAKATKVTYFLLFDEVKKKTSKGASAAAGKLFAQLEDFCNSAL